MNEQFINTKKALISGLDGFHVRKFRFLLSKINRRQKNSRFFSVFFVRYNSKEKKISKEFLLPLFSLLFLYLRHQKAPHFIIFECLVTWKGDIEWSGRKTLLERYKFSSNLIFFLAITLYTISSSCVLPIKLIVMKTNENEMAKTGRSVWMSASHNSRLSSNCCVWKPER